MHGIRSALEIGIVAVAVGWQEYLCLTQALVRVANKAVNSDVEGLKGVASVVVDMNRYYAALMGGGPEEEEEERRRGSGS